LQSFLFLLCPYTSHWSLEGTKQFLLDNDTNMLWTCFYRNPALIDPCAEQSSGKSSVLESIVGRDFLPRGSGGSPL
jgi:hypothetical protein